MLIKELRTFVINKLCSDILNESKSLVFDIFCYRRIMFEILQAVQFMHNNEITHRDLKVSGSILTVSSKRGMWL